MFLSLLDDHWKTGIDRGQLFEAGDSACKQMRAGQKMALIAMLADGEVQPDGSVHASGDKLGEAANFIHAAASAYCPDQLTGVN
ncbi:DUF732 domain-containing protein [Nocardia sp. NPDC057455]|uniref:DUF732 domain-containing protein n=1 Tax=Nocardia sp. NPDC057455 TaxID=3346138 RepID=UPI00366E6F4A